MGRRIEESDALCDNIKGQGTWRKGILGLADLTPLAIPSPQIMSIIIIIIFDGDCEAGAGSPKPGTLKPRNSLK